MEYEPSGRVVAVRTCPVLLVTVTVTFGTTAPDESVTVPEIAPVEPVCAETDEPQIDSRTAAHKHLQPQPTSLIIICLPTMSDLLTQACLPHITSACFRRTDAALT